MEKDRLSPQVGETQSRFESSAESAGDDLYQRLFRLSNDAIILHRIGAGIVAVNGKAAELVGYSEKQLEAMRIADLLVESGPAPTPEMIDTLRKDGGIRLESLFRHADGREIAVEISSALIDPEQGLVQGCLRDITAQRRESLRLLLRTSVSGLLESMDPDDFEKSIDEVCGLLGKFAGCERLHVYWRHQDEAGRDYMSNVNEWCAPGIESIKEQMQNLTVDDFPVWFKRLDAFEDIHIVGLDEIPEDAHNEREFFRRMQVRSLTSIPMVHAGRMVGFMGFVFRYEEKRWDESDLMLLRCVAESVANHRSHDQAQAHLRKSQERLREIADILPDFVFELDRSGNLIFVNENAYKVSGYSRDELLRGKHAAEIIAQDDRARARRNVARLLRGEYLGKNEYKVLRKDGSTFPVIAHSKPIFEDGEIVGVRGIFTDISKYKLAEERLRNAHAELIEANRDLMQTRKAAERASQAKSEFLGFMSHEIRTPLNAILGILDILDESLMGSETGEYITTLRSSSNALLDILGDILDFSRMETGMLTLGRSPFNPGTVLSQTVRLLRATASRKGLRLEIAVDEACNRTYFGDEGRVQQIMLNLMSNAIKFTDAGHVRASLRCERSSGESVIIRFEVADTGIGISRENRETVFDRFSQEQRGQGAKQHGSGLGLTICRQLSQMMGGEIGVESEFGVGSQFWVTLPLGASQDAQPATPAVPLEKRAATAEKSIGARVLIVEDDDIIQKVAATILERAGCTVVVAADGLEALKDLGVSSYDLILMDCQMPNLDGFETTRRIRADAGPAANIPIIAMTANALGGDREKCLEAGMNDYLCKPVSATELRQMARKWSDPKAKSAGAN